MGRVAPGSVLWALALCPIAACAAEITVLSAAAVKGPLTELAASFERETGHHVAFEFTTAGGVDARLAGGARPDLVINSRDRIDARAGRSPSGGVARNVGTVRVGVAMRAGAPRRDVSSESSLRAALLAVQSIAYTDPARGGTAGLHFARVLERLGVTEVIAGKVVLATDGLDVMQRVQRGEVELGITQKSEILHVDASTFVGLLPEEFQLATTYTAWVPDSSNPAALAFIEMLTRADGRARFVAVGFD